MTIATNQITDRHLEMAESSEVDVEFSEINPDSLKIQELEIAKEIVALKPVYERLTSCLGFGIDFGGDKTCFDHDRKTLVISITQLFGMGLTSPTQIHYIVMHEIGHYLELLQDPEGYESIINEAETIPAGNIIFKLYNCLQDIYVNTNTSNCSPQYRRGADFSDEVKDIYINHTFPKRDFSEQPLCMQYANYLLNLGMGVAEDIKLSPEVQTIIDQGLHMFGKQISYEAFINKFYRPVLNWEDSLFRPQSSAELSSSIWQGKVSQRKAITDIDIRPIFEKLLEKDKEAGRVFEIESLISSDKGRPLSGRTIEELKKIIESAKKIKKELNPSDQDKADKQRESQLRQAGEGGNIDPKKLTDFIERYQRLQNEINKLSEIWRKIKIPSTSWVSIKEGHFLTGDTLDLKRVITLFPEILSNPGNQDLMFRNLYRPEQSVLPKEIILILEIDCSGSMMADMTVVQDLVIALGASIIAKNSQAELDGEEIRCSLGLIKFSDNAEYLLKNSNEFTITDLMEQYSELGIDGGTSDHFAHKKVLSGLTPEKIEQIKSGECLAIMIEITDGETIDPEESKRLLKKIEGLGVITRAIEISGTRSADSEELSPEKSLIPEGLEAENLDGMFDDIWNRGQEKKGFRVSNAKYLAKTICKMLESFLNVE